MRGLFFFWCLFSAILSTSCSDREPRESITSGGTAKAKAAEAASIQAKSVKANRAVEVTEKEKDLKKKSTPSPTVAQPATVKQDHESAVTPVETEKVSKVNPSPATAPPATVTQEHETASTAIEKAVAPLRADNEQLRKALAELKTELSELQGNFGRFADNDTQHLEWLSRLSLVDPPVGTIVAFGGEWPPKRMDGSIWTEEELGWMISRGDRLENAKYPELFAAIGTAWGAVDDATFRAPHLAGFFLRGADYATGNDPEAKARVELYPRGNAGDRVGSLQKWATGRPGKGTTTEGKELVSEPKGPWDLTTKGKNRYGHDVHFDRLLAANALPANNTAGESDATQGEPDLFSSVPIKPVPAHSHKITGGGDVETRPTNVAVHWIIKFRATSPRNQEKEK